MPNKCGGSRAKGSKSNLASENSQGHFLGADIGAKYLKGAIVQSSQPLPQWPLRWEEGSACPKVVDSIRGTISWALSASLCTVMFAFMVFRLIQLVRWQNTDTSTVVFMFVLTVIYALPVAFYLGCGISAHEIVATITLAVPFFRKCEGKLH